ncbi:MAG: NTP transferase domain-containing protein [Myxococcota bacterium]
MAARIAVILAAGKGTRMKSDKAKVLHPFSGRPLVAYPIEAALEAGATRVVVVTGYQERAVQEAVEALPGLPADAVAFAHQAEQNGTGHAVLCALPEVPKTDALVWVLNGDTPLVRASTLGGLAEAAEASTAGLVMTTVRATGQTGYGRLIRDGSGAPKYIREERDCSTEEFAVEECNAGMYCVRAEHLHAELPTLGSDNAQGEIYLTDLVEVRAKQGTVAAVELDPLEAAGINTREQLEELEAAAARR